MLLLVKRLPWTALALVLVCPPGPARAQPGPLPFPQTNSRNFHANPYSGWQAGYNLGAARGFGYGYGTGLQVSPLYTPYYGTNVYQSYTDPYNGYMSGAASVISAQAQFLQAREQAALVREQVNQAKIETRRKNLEEYLYERERMPTLEDERERVRMERLRRARNDPPLNDILSALALNDLLAALEQAYGQGLRGAPVPLYAATLSHVNVTAGAAEAGSLAVLRDGGKLNWPLVLTGTDFEAERSRLDALGPQAYQQASAGRVQPDTLRGMTDAVNRLLDQLKARVADYTPNDYIRGKRFLHELEDAIRVLQQPGVANYLDGRWAATGHTVPELVANMSRLGLRFAPAVDGDQAAYVALHQALVAYDSSVQQLVAASQGATLRAVNPPR